MIRINLLPHQRARVSKKAVEVRNFLVGFGGLLALVIVMAMITSWAMTSKVAKLEAQKVQTTQELDQLKKKSAEIVNYEDDKRAFEEKIEVIRKLRSHQGQPVRFLDQLAHQLPDRVWLLRVQEADGRVTITGRALANSDIVEMIRKMKENNLLTGVQLMESKRVVEQSFPAYEFTLNATLGELAGAPQAEAS